MRIFLLAVGKPRNPGLAAAILEYEKRAARYWTFETREVREESARGTSAAVVRAREGDRLLERLPEDVELVACDVGGLAMTSEAFARWLGGVRDAARDVAFVVGGAFGLSEKMVRRSRRRLALAPWTLPHELARLVLVEQLYRAGTILRGEPYHK